MNCSFPFEEEDRRPRACSKEGAEGGSTRLVVASRRNEEKLTMIRRDHRTDHSSSVGKNRRGVVRKDLDPLRIDLEVSDDEVGGSFWRGGNEKVSLERKETIIRGTHESSRWVHSSMLWKGSCSDPNEHG